MLPLDVAKTRWTLEAWLEAKGRTRYQLAQAMDGNEASNQTTLYRLAQQSRVDLQTIDRIIEACERLTGERPAVGDLLEYQP